MTSTQEPTYSRDRPVSPRLRRGFMRGWFRVGSGTLFVLTLVAIALMVGQMARGEDGELRLPYPSDAWSASAVPSKPLFTAPPCAAANESCGSSQPCVDPRVQPSPYSSGDFSQAPFCDQ